MKNRQKITATIYNKRGKILTTGINSYTKSHPIQKEWAEKAGFPEKCFTHAEISAIIKLKHHHKPYSIFIERYDKNGNPKLAKPCPICELAIKSSGISVISYTI